MGLWYRLCPVTVIGGTYGPTEGHNPWEAAALGSAILYGPRTANFAADFTALRDHGAALEVGPESLGAALASEKDYREYMEGIKWWFIMAQAHDGGFVVMPGRDYASTDHVYATRNLPSACAALILSVKKKHLLITGAARAQSTPEAASNSATAPTVRKLRDGQLSKLNLELHKALGELHQAKLLKPWPMSLSTTKEKMWLATVASNGSLIFKNEAQDKESAVEFSALTTADHAMLARLVAALRPTSKEAQATAAVYQEIIGQTETANQYYRSAGTTLRNLCNALFE